ncbi:MAG: hypothetical protein ACOC9Y_02565 [Chloroflexota bacterium]
MLVLLLAAVMALAACGGDDDDGGGGGDVRSAADAENCEQVSDASLHQIQLMLDELSDMDLADMESEEPESFTQFEEEMEQIGEKSEELDCSDEEMAEHLRDGIDDLEADGQFGEMILEGLRQEAESGDLLE